MCFQAHYNRQRRYKSVVSNELNVEALVNPEKSDQKEKHVFFHLIQHRQVRSGYDYIFEAKLKYPVLNTKSQEKQ